MKASGYWVRPFLCLLTGVFLFCACENKPDPLDIDIYHDVPDQTRQANPQAVAAQLEALSKAYQEFMTAAFDPDKDEKEAAAKYKKIFEDRFNQGFKGGEGEVEVLVRLALSSIYQIEKNLDDAENIMIGGLEKYSGTPRLEITLLMELANFYETTEQIDKSNKTLAKAIEVIRGAISAEPRNLDYHQLYISILIETKGIEEGLEFYKSLKKKHPHIDEIDQIIDKLKEFEKSATYREFAEESYNSDQKEAE